MCIHPHCKFVGTSPSFFLLRPVVQEKMIKTHSEGKNSKSGSTKFGALYTALKTSLRPSGISIHVPDLELLSSTARVVQKIDRLCTACEQAYACMHFL